MRDSFIFVFLPFGGGGKAYLIHNLVTGGLKYWLRALAALSPLNWCY